MQEFHITTKWLFQGFHLTTTNLTYQSTGCMPGELRDMTSKEGKARLFPCRTRETSNEPFEPMLLAFRGTK